MSDESLEPTVALPDGPKSHTLAPGTRIHDYRIERVLGEGGFGIVYLATDIALERQVAIKEYLPSSMAERAAEGLTVQVKSAAHAETFAIGLRSFVNEAKLLAHFDHPALLKVHQFWEENGTAYMAMPYYQGQTLKAALARLGRLPTEREVRAWLMPLLDALEVMHEEQCYHRDIAPDNILLTDQGPLLLDFGAARRVIGDRTQSLTAMLKPGFAPIEQYGAMPGVTQGPWTDIFALASVLYAAISGSRTLPAVERLLDDPMPRLAFVATGRCGDAFLAAIDAALAIHPRDRPQSIAEFRALLTAEDTQALDSRQLATWAGTPPVAATALLPDFDPTQPTQPVAPRQPAAPAAATARTTAPVVAHVVAPVAAAVAAAVAPPAVPPASAAAPRRAVLLGLAGSAGLVLLGLGTYRLLSAPAPVPPAPAPLVVAQPPAAEQPAASAAASLPADGAASTVSGTAQLTPEAAPAPASTQDSAAASAPPSVAAAPAASKPRIAAPARAKPNGSRCSDILQKASLEALTPAETDYLKKECR
ncbi:MAG: serine/threonine protein kinase [Burkholderiales bacterium]|uniref:serine/threonine-protein kinase n=2 Tax=Pseudomonadota TaxID=1224 RepID=UPI000FC37BE8|nr:MAG: serine/threonine protein kinase [Burkholderiales bacterium]